MMFYGHFDNAFQSRRFSHICMVIVIMEIFPVNISYHLSPYHAQMSSVYEFVLQVIMRIFRLVSISVPPIYFTIILRNLHQRLVELNSSLRFVLVRILKPSFVFLFLNIFFCFEIGNDLLVEMILT